MIYIGADHRGFELKEYLRNHLIAEAVSLVDVGASTYDSGDDYVDFAKKVVEGVLTEPGNMGILICGSGVGVDIVANKFDGIRCALVEDVDKAKMSREHEDVNMIALPADTISNEDALSIVKVFMETKFSEEARHARRIDKIADIEESN